jgi:hypothetical protein
MIEVSDFLKSRVFQLFKNENRFPALFLFYFDYYISANFLKAGSLASDPTTISTELTFHYSDG